MASRNKSAGHITVNVVLNLIFLGIAFSLCLVILDGYLGIKEKPITLGDIFSVFFQIGERIVSAVRGIMGQ